MSWRDSLGKTESESTNRKRFPIDFNAPAILCLFFASLLLLGVKSVTGDLVDRLLACYFTRWADLFMYPRLFTHVLDHQNLSHLTGNYLLLLVVGPMLEEKHGSSNLIKMMIITAGITGMIHVVFFQNIILLGASGLVFMMILLASFTNIREGKLPVTVLLVGVLYIGNEVIRGVLSTDNISQLSHIIGGICGAGFGFILSSKHRSILDKRK